MKKGIALAVLFLGVLTSSYGLPNMASITTFQNNLKTVFLGS